MEKLCAMFSKTKLCNIVEVKEIVFAQFKVSAFFEEEWSEIARHLRFFLKKIGDDNDNDATENEEMCGIFFWHSKNLES